MINESPAPVVLAPAPARATVRVSLVLYGDQVVKAQRVAKRTKRSVSNILRAALDTVELQ